MLEGDLIANAVYDPNMHFRFMVSGDFDIDGTGQTSTTDRKRIEGMVTQWGGELETPVEGKAVSLNYDVDFLVLGQEPGAASAAEGPDRPQADPGTRRGGQALQRVRGPGQAGSGIEDPGAESEPVPGADRVLQEVSGEVISG